MPFSQHAINSTADAYDPEPASVTCMVTAHTNSLAHMYMQALLAISRVPEPLAAKIHCTGLIHVVAEATHTSHKLGILMKGCKSGHM